jgi:hypothetical protein
MTKLGGERAVYVDRLDHLVLTVASIEATTNFYVRVLRDRAGNLIELSNYP